jgi:predicted nucleic-acid-binding Zn-ribbon protein
MNKNYKQKRIIKAVPNISHIFQYEFKNYYYIKINLFIFLRKISY